MVCIINGNHLGCRHIFPTEKVVLLQERGGNGSWQSRNAREQHHLTTIARVGNNIVKDVALGNNGTLSYVFSIHHFMGISVHDCLFSAACSYEYEVITALYCAMQSCTNVE